MNHILDLQLMTADTQNQLDISCCSCCSTPSLFLCTKPSSASLILCH
ncbi:SapB/AmfS family lanthipeptide [Kibdelosporangium phytohabitans]|nr:hypothetical protein [Kibdelosporangium phytohabitans]